jgi:glycosyltransferase involved in cell wall biosynthesis
MTVSVVIPTYNRAGTVVQAVRSVLAQRFEDLELIVVDDGSTDDTASRLAAIPDERLRYVRGPHAGVSAARNLGVRHATGALVSFLDSDDLWCSDKLAHEVDVIAAHPEVDVVFSDLEKRHGDRVIPSFMRATDVFSRRLTGAAPGAVHLLGPRDLRICLLQEVPIKPSALTLRRSAIDRVGGFDEGWSSSEDWELLLRLARTHRFAYIDRPLAVLHISADSLHVMDQTRGETAMIRLLARERAELNGDAEALAAVRRGLVTRVKHFGWHYVRRGQRFRACRVFLNGFALTGAPGLLARALAVWLPWTRHSTSPTSSERPAAPAAAQTESDQPLAHMSDHS